MKRFYLVCLMLLCCAPAWAAEEIAVGSREMIVGSGAAATGETYTVTLNDDYRPPAANLYWIVDWGDGERSHEGPVQRTIPFEMSHVYARAGEYEIRAMYALLPSGDRYDGFAAHTVVVTGEDYAETPLSGARASSNGITDKVWTSGEEGLTGGAWTGVLLDDMAALGRAEIDVPESCAVFPQNFSVEYTTDGGETWYMLPRLYYLCPQREGYFNPLMNYPNPAGKTLSLPLFGVSGNGVRIVSKMYPLDAQSRRFEVSDVRVYAGEEAMFSSSRGGVFDADINNMYKIFTVADTEPKLNGVPWGDCREPFEGGAAVMTSTEWLAWDGMQVFWSDYREAIDSVTAKLFALTVTEDDLGRFGYVCANPNAKYHLDVQAHYDYNAIFIIALRDYLCQRNDARDVLEIQNADGMSLSDRCEAAMAYQLDVLGGENGLIVIDDPANDATPDAHASTYWDAYAADGYLSAFCNCQFYLSLEAMADICDLRGDAAGAKAYRARMETTRAAFNETFWNAETGRYALSVDASGRMFDWGMTYVNVTCVAAGLADGDQAKSIYDWLDGARAVSGDTSTGADIYHYGFAPRANTLALSSTGEPYYWETWNHTSALSCAPGGNGDFGRNIQNGGAIFYVSFYDLMGRLRAFGSDAAEDRLSAIMAEFHQDQLRRRNLAYVSTDVGILREFPESGLVPLYFLYGYLGLRTEPEGLVISPDLPADMDWARVARYVWNGAAWDITVSRNALETRIEQTADGFRAVVPAEGETVLSMLD